jgi:hypothetical protein
VFRLLKLLTVLLGLGVFVWFGANIPLGSQTLFQHLQAIGRTRETKDLLDGTRDRARPLVDDVRRRLAGAAAPDPDPDERPAARPDGGAAARPPEQLTSADRQRLRKLLGAAADGKY